MCTFVYVYIYTHAHTKSLTNRKFTATFVFIRSTIVRCGSDMGSSLSPFPKYILFLCAYGEQYYTQALPGFSLC